MSLFLGSFTDAPKTKFTRILIKGAKNNWKYRVGKQKKKYQRRIRDNDIENFKGLAIENNINMGYDETCDDIWFETRVEGASDIILDGLNTGGQFIRNVIQIAINSGPGREVDLTSISLPPFFESDRIQISKNGKEIRKNGKSNMLVGVQMRMWSMRVGDSVYIEGGDPLNSDALAWDKHTDLFDKIRAVFGYNYRLENSTGADGLVKFTLFRDDNVEPSVTTISVDIYTADQLFMAAMGHLKLTSDLKLECSKNRQIIVKFPKARDYHPDAMIYALRVFGFTVVDSKPEGLDNEQFKEWLSSEGEREVSFHI
jgi:hypothetical protein